jgi:hypothetical protein
MNLKKLLILPVAFLLTNIMYIACCKCPPPNNHYEVTSIKVTATVSGGMSADNGIAVTADTFYLNYNFLNKCVAKVNNYFSFLVNTSTACKCSECGRNGLNHKVTNIKISSDTIFNGIAPNQSLNSLFLVKSFYNNNSPYSIDSLIKSVNINTNVLLGTYSLYTKVKPGNTAKHKFTLSLSFDNSSNVNTTSNQIFWQ